MNVASLELCKELYEFSGWNTPHEQLDFITYRNCPAYNLGYLLRKLHTNRVVFTLRHAGTYWLCDAGQLGNGQSTDSPEDATAKLCIELFKQGILK